MMTGSRHIFLGSARASRAAFAAFAKHTEGWPRFTAFQHAHWTRRGAASGTRRARALPTMRNRTNGPVRHSLLGGGGFTLIEMLTVLVIMGIMLGIGIPAVTNLMKSGGLSAATRQVSNTLSQARQYAITQRVYARVVFAYGAPASTNPQDMLYRTYAVMTNPDRTVLANWTYATKWEYLPTGVVFLNNAANLTAGGLGALDDLSSLNSQSGVPFPIPGTPNNQGTLAYIEFNPTGAATALTLGGGSGASTLAITEGFMDSTGTPRPTATKTSVGGPLANVTTITVDNIVGRIRVTRP